MLVFLLSICLLIPSAGGYRDGHTEHFSLRMQGTKTTLDDGSASRTQ